MHVTHGKEISDFHEGLRRIRAQRYRKADLLGKWSWSFILRFTFVCPTELSDLAGLTKNRASTLRSMPCPRTVTLSTRLRYDASETIRQVKYPMLADPTGKLAGSLGSDEDEGMALRGSFVINPEGEGRGA